jgi:hypothetical protein
MLMTVAPEVTLEGYEAVMEFDATYTTRKKSHPAPTASCN